MYHFKKISPSPKLQPYFSGYWILKKKPSKEGEKPLLLIPDGHPELFFTLKNQFEFSDGKERKPFPKRGFIGQFSSPLRLFSKRGSIGLFVKMYPFTPFLLTKTPQKLLKNDICDLENLMNPVLLKTVHEAIGNAPSLEKAIQILEKFLTNLIIENEAIQPILKLTIQKIFENSGQVSMDFLTKGIQVSSRYLEKLFQREIGLSPNQYANLIKLKKASVLLSEIKKSQNLSDFAQENGFYDHAHFSRNFKKLAGITPTEFVNYSNDFPIEEKSNYLNQWSF